MRSCPPTLFQPYHTQNCLLPWDDHRGTGPGQGQSFVSLLHVRGLPALSVQHSRHRLGDGSAVTPHRCQVPKHSRYLHGQKPSPPRGSWQAAGIYCTLPTAAAHRREPWFGWSSPGRVSYLRPASCLLFVQLLRFIRTEEQFIFGSSLLNPSCHIQNCISLRAGR